MNHHNFHRSLTAACLLTGLGCLGSLSVPNAMASTAIASPGSDHAPIAIAQAVPINPTQIQEILAAHNRYRGELGIEPLTWSNSLATSAAAWATQLANGNSFEHSQGGDYGENIWMGSSGGFSFTEMVDGWGEEQQYFIPNAAFPDVSNTGDWSDVGHYTQIIWADTTEVGCGMADGTDGMTRLVCQYSPPGNYEGEMPY